MRILTSIVVIVALAGSCATEAGTASASSAAWRTASGEGFLDLCRGDRPVLRHVTPYDPSDHARTFRTFDEVFGFHGEGFITKGPGGKYPHHRGLFIGWNKTGSDGRTFDFWHGTDGVALRHRGYEALAPAVHPDSGRLVATTDWTDAAGSAVVSEQRDVTARFEADGTLVLDYRFTLAAVSMPVRLDGDPHHAGFQFRAAQEVAERAAETRYLRPATARDLGNDVWDGCEWTAGRFAIHGHPYTVVHMDHPTNPRPVVYSTRDYGRFGSFFRVTIEPGTPLELRYRILVIDGTHPAAGDAAALAAGFRAFAAPP